MLLKISYKIINKQLLVKFKFNKFAILIFMTFGMWKCEYDIFNLPRDYEINGS